MSSVMPVTNTYEPKQDPLIEALGAIPLNIERIKEILDSNPDRYSDEGTIRGDFIQLLQVQELTREEARKLDRILRILIKK